MKQVSKERLIAIKKELYADQKWVLRKPKTSREFKAKLADRNKKIRKEQKRKAIKSNSEVEKIHRKAKLTKFAMGLNANLPRSEKWFWKHYQRFSIEKDIKNGPWGYYIFDIINHEYRYAIEVDGKSHEQESQKRQDARKNDYAKRHNYLLVRVIAYDDTSMKIGLSRILAYRRQLEAQKKQL